MNEHYFNFCNSRYTSADDDLVTIEYPGYLATLNEEIYGTFFIISYTTQNRELKQLDYIAEPRNNVTNRENSFDYNDSIQRYVVDFNTTLYIEHLIKNENEDENEDGPITCISQIYIADLMMTALPVKDYPSCSDELCAVPSLKSSNLCNQQSQWLLDKPGNFDIHLNLSISNEGLFNSRIKVYVSEMHRQLNTTEQVLLPETSLTMTSSTFKHSVKGTNNTKVTKQLLVEVSPAPKTKHSQPQLNSCSQISVQVKTNLTFIISSNLNTKYILKINGGIKQITNNIKLSQIFNSVGNFTVEIVSETEADIFNWTKQITVLEDLSQKVQIDFLPRIAEHSPAIKTLTNVMFFIYVKGECISTPDSLNWEIDTKTLQGESVNVTFDKVGPNVQALPVKIAEFPKLELPINLYDVISNFRVSFADGFKGVFCENTPIVQLGLSQDIGTAVQYFYAEGNSNPIHPIPQNKSISIKSKNIKRMRFRAKNVVSNEEVIKNVEFTDQIVFVFKKKRYIVYNEQVTIRPEKFRACEEYNYRWIVDKTYRNPEVGKAHKIPELHDTFSKVETVIVQLTVLIGSDPRVTYNHVIEVVVEERVRFSFSDVRILLYANEKFDLIPNVSSISEEFEYKWNNRQFSKSSSMSDLTETINKKDEGIFTYKLEIRNNVSRTVKGVKVYVQNPIDVIFNNEPLNVEVNKSFQVSLQFKQRSKLGYQITVKDDDDLDKNFNITDTIFKFNHTYTNLGQVNQTFTITDIKNNKVFRSKSIRVEEPLISINVTVGPLRVRVGETVHGRVNSVIGYQRPSFYWYVTNKKGHRSQISTDAELNSTFSSIGMKQIDLEAFSSVSKIVRSFNITVYDNEQLKIFTVIDDALVAATENITVAINSEVKFNIGNITSSENDLGFKWYVDNDEITDKQDLIHTFEKNGVIVVEVRLVDEDSNVLGKSNILVNVVLRLLNVGIHLYNENEKLENNSLITSTNSTKVYLNNVTYTPDDVGHVTVNVTCIRIITNNILYQSTLHLSNFEEISILWLQKGIGEIHCRFTTYNIVSKIQTNFRFVFLKSNGSMNFINSPDVVKVNKQAIFTIQLNNNLLPGNLRWVINGTIVGMCFAAITHQKNTTSCEYTFITLNVFLITVEYQTEYYKLTESFNVRVADPITKVSLVPKIFEVNRARNLTVKMNSCCVLTYLWKEFDSTASLVTFTPKQSGKKNVTVIVSNKISTLTHTETVTIYPFFTQNDLSIILGGGSKKLAFEINEPASLQSSLHGELINLTWYVTDKNNCKQTIILPQLFLACAKAGVYQVMLNASTPFRYVTDIINVTVVAPIGKVTIRPKYIIKTNVPVNLTASSDGTGNKKFLWWQYSVNKSWVLFNASKPGAYPITVNVRNEASQVNITETIIVYKEFNFDIVTTSEFPITSKKINVLPGKLIAFSIYDFDSNSLIHWKIEPNVTIHYTNDTFIEIEFSSNYTDTTYLLNLTVANKLANKTKSLYISVIKPLNIVTQNLKENVIVNSFYSFNLTYGDSGNVTVKSFNVTGVRNFTYIQRNGYVTVNITTGSTRGSITVLADICNEINCASKLWRLFSNEKVEKIEAKLSKEYISLNSSVKFQVKQKGVPDTNYTWYILPRVNQTCPKGSCMVKLVSNETACRIGQGEIFSFHAQEFFGIGNEEGRLITGKYEARMIAEGFFIEGGTQIVDFVITVFFENCKKPGFDYRENRSLTRSKWFYAEINVTTKCSVRNNWTFYQISSPKGDSQSDDDDDNEKDDDDGRDDDDGDEGDNGDDDNDDDDDDDDDDCSVIKSTNFTYKPTMLSSLTLSTYKPVLEIPPRAFEIGKYCIRNTFIYGDKGHASINILLTVSRTPLVPVIVGGMYRVIGNEDKVMLDASRTIDPDVSHPDSSSIQYIWKGNMTCLNNTDGWDVSNAKLEIRNNCLIEYAEYSFEVNVKRINTDGKDEKAMSATQKVISNLVLFYGSFSWNRTG